MTAAWGGQGDRWLVSGDQLPLQGCRLLQGGLLHSSFLPAGSANTLDGPPHPYCVSPPHHHHLLCLLPLLFSFPFGGCSVHAARGPEAGTGPALPLVAANETAEITFPPGEKIQAPFPQCCPPWSQTLYFPYLI